MNKRILNIALPSIVSNITVPLLGLVDVAIVGHLGAASYIGAIAVGGMLFNMIYWIFGFLRMGTSGLTSQALGKRDLAEVVRHLVRALAVGLGIALILVALQKPLMAIAFRFISATPEVADLAATYFHICVWGAPAVLGLYGFAGWYIGMQNSRFPMYIAIVQNVVNIAASLGFVFGLGMKVEGVALGTLIAQYSGLGMAIILWLMYYSRLREHFQWVGCFRSGAMKQFFALNRDIFFRTLGYFLPDALPCGGNGLLYLDGSGAWGCNLGGQYLADAAVHPLFLYHGRICLRRRGVVRTLRRGEERDLAPEDDAGLVWLGNRAGGLVYPPLRSRR